MCNEIKKLYAQYPFLKEADSLSKICLLLKWKAELLGKYYYQVDTYYPSSKKYSHCDNKTDKTNNLSVRNSPCEVCGNEND